MLTRDALLFLQQVFAKTDQSLTLAGDLSNSVSVQGSTAQLAQQVANLDANGIVLPNGINRWSTSGSSGQTAGQNLLFNPIGAFSLNGWTAVGSWSAEAGTGTNTFPGRFYCDGAQTATLSQKIIPATLGPYVYTAWLEIDQAVAGMQIGVDIYDATTNTVVASQYESTAGNFQLNLVFNLPNLIATFYLRLYYSSTASAGAYWYQSKLQLGSIPGPFSDDRTAAVTGATHNPAGGQGLDGILQGVQNFSVTRQLLPYSGNSTPWVKIGTLTGGVGTRFTMEVIGSYGGGTPDPAQVNGYVWVVATNGEGTGAPNLQGYWYYEGASSLGAAVLSIKGVCTDQPSTGLGNVWDIYIQQNKFSDGNFAEVRAGFGSLWIWNIQTSSDPGTGVNISVFGGGANVVDENTHINTHLTNGVNQFDPDGTLRQMGLLGYHTLANWPDGGGRYAALVSGLASLAQLPDGGGRFAALVQGLQTLAQLPDGGGRFAALVEGLATADNLPAGVIYEIATIARLAGAMDAVGNLLFKSYGTSSVTSGITLSGSPQAITGNISLTTHGHPVCLFGVMNLSALSAGAQVNLLLYRDGSAIAGVGNFGSYNIPINGQDGKCVLYFDNAPGAGSHTYTVYAYDAAGTSTTQAGFFFALELA